MSSIWFTEEFTYQQTYGLEVRTESSGYLNIEPVNSSSSESFSIPFLWWWPQSSSNFGFKWWDDYEVALGQPVNSWIDDLRLIRFDPAQTSNGQQSYFLVLPKLSPNIDPFISFESAELALNTLNPTVEPDIFNLLLKSNYRVSSVEEVELDLPDLFPQLDKATVPESSSVAGILVLGVAFVGVLLKRSFFQGKKRKVSYS